MQHFLPGALAHLAMERCGKHARFVELARHMLAGVAGGHKHQHTFPAVLGEQVAQQGGATFLVHRNRALGNVGFMAFKSFHRDAHRIAQQLRRQGFDFRGKRGRKQQGLALGGQQRQHALQFFSKSQVEQAVGFVQHQMLHIRQTHSVLVDQIEQTAGRGHHNVGTAPQRHHLRIDRDPAKDDGHFERLGQFVGQIGQHLTHLHGQFPRGD